MHPYIRSLGLVLRAFNHAERPGSVYFEEIGHEVWVRFVYHVGLPLNFRLFSLNPWLEKFVYLFWLNILRKCNLIEWHRSVVRLRASTRPIDKEWNVTDGQQLGIEPLLSIVLLERRFWLGFKYNKFTYSIAQWLYCSEVYGCTRLDRRYVHSGACFLVHAQLECVPRSNENHMN